MDKAEIDRLKEFEERIRLFVEAHEKYKEYELNEAYKDAFKMCLIQFRSIFKEELN